MDDTDTEYVTFLYRFLSKKKKKGTIDTFAILILIRIDTFRGSGIPVVSIKNKIEWNFNINNNQNNKRLGNREINVSFLSSSKTNTYI